MAGEGKTAERIVGEIVGALLGIQLDDEAHPSAPRRYRVGHTAPSVEACYLAAVKACGDGALLYGPAAAFLWGLLRGPPPRPHVLIRTDRQLPGVVTRRTRRRAGPEGTAWRGIPISTVPRTLVDLAAGLAEDDLARACHEAGVRYGVTPREVEAVLARRPNAEGAGTLRSHARRGAGDPQQARGSLPHPAAQRQLPLPVTNRPAGGRRVDCRWAEQRLTVELDSYTFHNSRHSWEQDRRREREARARDDEFRRYSRDDVFVRPETVVRELRGLLVAYRPPLWSSSR